MNHINRGLDWNHCSACGAFTGTAAARAEQCPKLPAGDWVQLTFGDWIKGKLELHKKAWGSL